MKEDYASTPKGWYEVAKIGKAWAATLTPWGGKRFSIFEGYASKAQAKAACLHHYQNMELPL